MGATSSDSNAASYAVALALSFRATGPIFLADSISESAVFFCSDKILFKNAIFSAAGEEDAVSEGAAGEVEGGHVPSLDLAAAVLVLREFELVVGVIFNISRNNVDMVGFSNPSITGDKCSVNDLAISILS